jgi:hypothetical protein
MAEHVTVVNSENAPAPSHAPEPDPELRRKLLRTFPDVEVENGGLDVVDALVQGAVVELLNERGASALLTVSDVNRAIRDSTGLEYQTSELIASLERLSRAGNVQFRGDEHKAFLFSHDRYIQLQQKKEQRHQIEERIRFEWIERIRPKYRLTQKALTTLWMGLEAFVTDLVHTRAEEAAAFLYMTDEMGQVRFHSVLEGKLPEVRRYVPADLQELAESEFPRFFNAADPICVDYLSDRLHAAFYFHLLSIDPLASELVRDHLGEKVLFLDTNFLYRLLALHGPMLAYTPATLVELAKTLKCRLVVAEESVREFLRSLRAEIHKLRAVPLRRDTYKRIAAEHPTDEWDFMQAFYKEWLSGRVKDVSEFERKYSNMAAMLNEWGIEIDEEAFLRDEDKIRPDYQQQFSDLNSWHHSEKPTESIDHDVFIGRLIRSLRGTTDTTPAKIKHWFVTYDRRLTVYSVYHSDADHQPFCMLADDWLQIVRPFVPRTEDYGRSFVSMLAHPLLYQESKRNVPFEMVAGALQRLERYSELPLPVVSAMVADAEFVRRLQATGHDKEGELIELEVKKVTERITADNSQLRHKLQAATARLERLEGTIKSLRSAKRELAGQLNQVEQEKEHIADGASRSVNALEEKLEEIHREAADAIEQERRRSAEQVELLAGTVRKLAHWGGFLVGSVVIGLLAAGVMTRFWSGLSVPRRAVLMGWFVLAEIALLAIPLRSRAFTFLAWVFGLISVLGLSFQIWTM